MADDAGALLVRSGLVPTSALDDARSRVANHGGTVGEQLVTTGAIGDDVLTDFYRSRLLVPQVNPNTLARLPARVIAAIPSDMAIELRAIPVALDGDNNLTVAMSDPSDRHAVDEIAFFTGAYVVRAVATQMQIAWCLAHYYGHVTALGQRLLQPGSEPPTTEPAPAGRAAQPPRARGLTGKVDAMRHRGIAPIMAPGALDLPRPRSGQIMAQPSPIAAPVDDPVTAPVVRPITAPMDDEEPPLRAVSSPDMLESSDGVPHRPRARSVSGEIRLPSKRAPSIRPAMPDPHVDDDESGPVITVEVMTQADEDPTGPRKVPMRKRKAKTDPPELAARAGEVEIGTGPVRPVDDEARIIIADDIEAPPPATMAVNEVSGELRVVAKRNDSDSPATTIEVDDTSAGVVIHERIDRDESQPILLDQRRPVDEPEEVVELAVKPPRARTRPEKRTQVGIGALPAVTRAHRDTEAEGVPQALDDMPTGVTHAISDDDPTGVAHRAVAPAPGDETDETVLPPSPARTDDTNPNLIAAPPRPSPARDDTGPIDPPSADDDDDDDDDENDDDDDDRGPATSVMSALELDAAIPQRTSEVVPAHLDRAKHIDHDPVDDGWGPPGTTIPPPLLGSIPGGLFDPIPGVIPVTDVDSAPLIVAAPSPPQARSAEAAGQTAMRALEDATKRLIELIRALEHTVDRDDVIDVMIDHLAEAHQRAGFFAIKAGELSVFSIQPRPATLPYAPMRLDRPSTMQDVVGTRLPYRGPLTDEASRSFFASVLGSVPDEILLVPVAVRERVVGVLFGADRSRHTFDDQLALASRAAGMALERILKTKRS